MSALDALAAHMVGDYILQTNDEAVNKTTNKKALLTHVAKYTLAHVPVAVASDASYTRKGLYLAGTFITHAIIDHRRWVSGDDWPPKPILVDQSLHAVQLAVLERLL